MARKSRARQRNRGFCIHDLPDPTNVFERLKIAVSVAEVLDGTGLLVSQRLHDYLRELVTVTAVDGAESRPYPFSVIVTGDTRGIATLRVHGADDALIEVCRDFLACLSGYRVRVIGGVA